jgi:hypothetical protein
MKKVLQFLLTGLVVGTILGWLLSLVSGNVYVVIGVGTIGMVVGLVLGIVHRNDP